MELERVDRSSRRISPAAARRFLREKFLRVQVGFSGANFAIADTGSVCVVESEGNGRMCVTLPRLLVTLVGIEKVVPSFRDLEVFLQLLPRSATGERMNPYNSIWTGVTAGDGPDEFHVVLLDNGRTTVLADEQSRETLDCIRCGACLNACPVYRQTGGHAYGSIYSGPIGAILTPQLQSMEQSQSLPYASSLCGACYEVCPVKIDIPEILIHLRRQIVERGDAPMGERLAMKAAGFALADSGRLAAAQKLARAAQWPFERDGHLEHLPPPLNAWTQDPRSAGHPAAIVPGMVGVAPTGRRAMSGARDEVLGRIRGAIGRPVDRPRPRTTTWCRDAYRQAGALDVEARLDLFRSRIEHYDCGSSAARGEQLAATVSRCVDGARQAAADSACWRAGRVAVGRHSNSCEMRDRATRSWIGCDGAITGCTVAIAQTGTIVLCHGDREGRRALTLIPDYHLCVVFAEQVVETVAEGLRQPDVARSALITTISGPSATADIEMTRVKGVHGPRTLDVVLVDGGLR